jgi:hypothetical protein
MKNNIYIIVILLLIIVGCDVGVNKKPKNSDDNNQVTPPPTGTINPSQGCFDPGVGSSSTDYYTFEIVGRGRVSPSEIGWQSSMRPTYLNYTATESTYFLNQFKTDGRFNIRLVVRPSPGRTSPEDGTSGNLSVGVNAAYGCSLLYKNYTKLQVKIRVRTPSSGYYQDHIFDNIPVDGCSSVKEFSIPATNDPIDVQVMSVNWDYDCIDYANRGFPDHPNACPWHYVNINSCYRLEIQLATAYTKDIPH